MFRDENREEERRKREGRKGRGREGNKRRIRKTKPEVKDFFFFFVVVVLQLRWKIGCVVIGWRWGAVRLSD